MNFLAHLYLSQHNEDLQLGNFIADWVKGKNILNYPQTIQAGIIMHRKIDSFTDCHPIVHNSKLRFRDIYGKYAGVFVDVLYDHFLAKNWKTYSNIELTKFASNFYLLATKKYNFLPERIKFFLPHLIFSNRLVEYKSLEGFEKSIQIMEMRTSLPEHSHNALELVRQDYLELELEFETFFEEIKKTISC